MALTRRKAPAAPKPVPEDLYETALCAPVETVVTNRKRVLCKKCKQFDEYRNDLCFNHYKESMGFEFNAEQNRFLPVKKRRTNAKAS